MAQVACYDDYLNYEYPLGSPGADAARAEDAEEHRGRLAEFPHAVVLELAYVEMDYANRWIWKRIGPQQGECHQASSVYPVCAEAGKHEHEGDWMTQWLTKTDYDFGLNEWLFRRREDLEAFLEFVPSIDWGESYPK